MRRFIIAVILGVAVEVAVLYALFDQRVTFQTSAVDSRVNSPQASTN